MKWYYLTGIIVLAVAVGFAVRYATEDKHMIKASATSDISELDAAGNEVV